MAEQNKTSNNTTNSSAATATAEQHARNAASALDARLSGPLAPLEKSLNDAFGEKASYQLPKELKELIVKFAPWLALIGGALSIFSAYGIWEATRRVNQWAVTANQWAESLGVDAPVRTAELNFSTGLSIVVMLVVAVLSLLAFPGLKDRKKVGWNLLFYGLLVNIAHSIITLFTDNYSMGSFVMTLVISAIGLYFLFQLRSYYVDKK